MKYLGGVLLLLYAAMLFTGYEPLPSSARPAGPAGVRRGHGGGGWLWTGGMHGGK